MVSIWLARWSLAARRKRGSAPDGDGKGTYLIAGNDCMASAPDVALCEDLDGDGYAGYPDSQ